jgi:molybdenum cofactor synthesis domain-containing protein
MEALRQVNMLGEIALATLHTMQEVQKGQAVAGTRIIPLVIEEEKIKTLEQIVETPFVSVVPFRPLKVGVVTTGNEVYTGRIKDCFGPILKEKFAKYGCTVIGQTFTNDEAEMTASAIREFIAQGADLVACTGGMSVDPDDRTPLAIRSVADRVVSYGAPTFPMARRLAENSRSSGAPGQKRSKARPSEK